jgi:hypothetical protein
MDSRQKLKNISKIKRSIQDRYKIYSAHHDDLEMHVEVSKDITNEELEKIHQVIKDLGYKQFTISYSYNGDYKKLWTQDGRLRPNCLAGDKDEST